MSYLHTVGEVGAAAWEAAAGSVGSAGANNTNGNCVPWPGEEGLARGRDEGLWPPLVFSMTTDRTRLGYPPRIPRVVPPSEIPLYNP